MSDSNLVHVLLRFCNSAGDYPSSVERASSVDLRGWWLRREWKRGEWTCCRLWGPYCL